MEFPKKMDNSTNITKQQTFANKIFNKLTDPRRTNKGNLQHKLTDIIFLVISAVVSGANDWKNIEIFGKSQLSWLRKFASFENGIPSHDTLGRFFSQLNTAEFGKCFSEWAKKISKLTEREIIAIDGKRLRGSYNTASGKSAIHMVSAYASENGLCLGQVSCEEKSNEITAIPKLLDIIAVKGCTVTIDAMGCQKEITKKIRDKEADYILAVKENQKELLEQVKKVHEITKSKNIDVSIDSGHGRIENRKCTVTDNLRFFDVAQQWKDVRTVIKIESERYMKINGKTQKEERYYISSSEANAKRINKAVRNHWSIENNLHWMLDVVFNEDRSRRRQGNSAANFNLISKIALALVSKEESKKISKKGKRYRAALDTKFREKILRI